MAKEIKIRRHWKEGGMEVHVYTKYQAFKIMFIWYLFTIPNCQTLKNLVFSRLLFYWRKIISDPLKEVTSSANTISLEAVSGCVLKKYLVEISWVNVLEEACLKFQLSVFAC